MLRFLPCFEGEELHLVALSFAAPGAKRELEPAAKSYPNLHKDSSPPCRPHIKRWLFLIVQCWRLLNIANLEMVRGRVKKSRLKWTLCWRR